MNKIEANISLGLPELMKKFDLNGATIRNIDTKSDAYFYRFYINILTKNNEELTIQVQQSK